MGNRQAGIAERMVYGGGQQSQVVCVSGVLPRFLYDGAGKEILPWGYLRKQTMEQTAKRISV